eukprot:SM007285S21505  [mRNA]  locus=s7285:34:734:- [translate_table: standard]
MAGSLAAYCAAATPEQAAEYLLNIVGDSDATRAITAEYAAKWAPASAPSGGASGGGDGSRMRAYVKPREEGDYMVAGRKTRDGSSGTDVKATVPPPVTAGAGAAGSSTKKTRKGRAVELAELGAGRALLPRRGPCECQASRHRLVANCLSCGRI